MATIPASFNERIFEFCANFDLVRSAGALIAGYVPGIPSPQEEADLGWDARAELPEYGRIFLLQYKVSTLTTKRYGPNAKFWDVHGGPYRRFNLHRASDGTYTQHRRLVDASSIGFDALYCAPSVQSRGELIDQLRRGMVMQESALIDAGSLGAATPQTSHSVSYPVNEGTPPYLHSEPQPGERLPWVQVRSRRQPERLDEALFATFVERTRSGDSRIRRPWREVPVPDSRSRGFLLASLVAHQELDATLAIVGADEVPQADP